MKDVFDMVIDVRGLVNIPAVTNLLTGKVYPNLRPDGSTKGDVVVYGLGIDNDQIQDGYGNINGYLPMIPQNGVSITDQTGLMNLGKQIALAIDLKFKTNFRVWVDEAPKLSRDTDGKHYVNVKYHYQSIQENKNNI